MSTRQKYLTIFNSFVHRTVKNKPKAKDSEWLFLSNIDFEIKKKNG